MGTLLYHPKWGLWISGTEFCLFLRAKLIEDIWVKGHDQVLFLFVWLLVKTMHHYVTQDGLKFVCVSNSYASVSLMVGLIRLSFPVCLSSLLSFFCQRQWVLGKSWGLTHAFQELRHWATSLVGAFGGRVLLCIPYWLWTASLNSPKPWIMGVCCFNRGFNFIDTHIFSVLTAVTIGYGFVLFKLAWLL